MECDAKTLSQSPRSHWQGNAPEKDEMRRMKWDRFAVLKTHRDTYETCSQILEFQPQQHLGRQN